MCSEFIRTDLFHYLANMPFRYLVLVYTVTYFLGWVIFTFWWQVAAEGCEPKDLTFRRAFLLSLETMTTIGYGVSDPLAALQTVHVYAFSSVLTLQVGR